jgi:hypothetical protein
MRAYIRPRIQVGRGKTTRNPRKKKVLIKRKTRRHYRY